MSVARIFDIAEHEDYGYIEPPTDPHGIPPVQLDVCLPVSTRSWIPLQDLWAPISETSRYIKKVTKPTRIGYRVRRRENRKYLANPYGDFLADHYIAQAQAAESEDALFAAIEKLKMQVRSNSRQAYMRHSIVYGPRVAAMGGGAYVHFITPAWEQGVLAVGFAALITTRWTLRGRRVMRARKRVMAKRRGSEGAFERNETDNTVDTNRTFVPSFEEKEQEFGQVSEAVVVVDSNLDITPDRAELQRDPRYRLLYDILDVAKPTEGQILDDPLSEFVIQTNPLVELLRKHSPEYKTLDRSELFKRLGRFGLRSHQKNLPPTPDGKRPNMTGWHFQEIRDVIDKGTQWDCESLLSM